MSEFPLAPYWVIFTRSSRHVPGDERSRTAPGHGYPDHYEEYTNVQTFTDKSAWERAVSRKVESGTRGWQAAKVLPAAVTTTVKVDVDADL